MDNDEPYEFDAAADYVGGLAVNKDKSITDDMLLHFYALYKQATVGPCNTPKPGFFDRKGLAKWNAWNKLGDMSLEIARQSYVDQLSHIHPNWNSQANIMSASDYNKTNKNTSIGPVFSSLITADDDDHLTSVNNSNRLDLPPLLLAASLGDIPTLTSIIQQLDVPLDTIKDANGCTALHWAADKGHIDAIATLLASSSTTSTPTERGSGGGGDHSLIDIPRSSNNNSISFINAVDVDGMSALYYAVLSEQKKAAEMLLQFGAAIDEDVVQSIPDCWKEKDGGVFSNIKATVTSTSE